MFIIFVFCGYFLFPLDLILAFDLLGESFCAVVTCLARVSFKYDHQHSLERRRDA